MNFNKLILAGRLTRDPESRAIGDGKSVTTFGLAVSEKRKDNYGKEHEKTLFIDCAAFGTVGDIVAKYSHKGDLILVDGKLELQQWDDKASGAKRSKHCMIVNTVQLGPRRQPTSRPPQDEQPEPESFTPDAVPF